MKIIFRVDASTLIGTGHLMRCLTLAETLRQRGANILFICRTDTGSLIERLSEADMPVKWLPASRKLGENTKNQAAGLGSTQAADAAETIEALRSHRPDWLIVDHYDLDVQWERALRPHVGKLMVIDDLNNRHHDCDVLLDQNYATIGKSRYQNLVPENCLLLLGPRYALLRPEYAENRIRRVSRTGQVHRILIFFGGIDPANITGMVLTAMTIPELEAVHIDVVIGANNPHHQLLLQQVAQRPLTTLYGPRPHLADLMVHADLALGAGGATTWERLCLGLPSVVISFADNQVPACVSLAASGFIHYLGPTSTLKSEQICLAVLTLMDNAQLLMNMSDQGQSLVDGLGAIQVSEHLVPCPVTKKMSEG